MHVFTDNSNQTCQSSDFHYWFISTACRNNVVSLHSRQLLDYYQLPLKGLQWQLIIVKQKKSHYCLCNWYYVSRIHYSKTVYQKQNIFGYKTRSCIIKWCVVMFYWVESSPLFICECWVKKYFTHFHSIVLFFFPLKATAASCKYKMRKSILKLSDNLGQNKRNKYRNFINLFSRFLSLFLFVQNLPDFIIGISTFSS